MWGSVFILIFAIVQLFASSFLAFKVTGIKHLKFVVEINLIVARILEIVVFKPCRFGCLVLHRILCPRGDWYNRRLECEVMAAQCEVVRWSGIFVKNENLVAGLRK